jgi:branched-chain amino acid transport system permease protein
LNINFRFKIVLGILILFGVTAFSLLTGIGTRLLIYGGIDGAVLALIAIGFSLVYGVGGILNLAHGAFYLVAAYVMFWLLPFLGVPLNMVVAVAIATLVGALSFLLLMKPLQRSPVGVVIITFGLAFFMEQIVFAIEGMRTGGIVVPVYVNEMIPGYFSLPGIIFPAQLLFAFFGSIIVVSLVAIIISKSKVGKSIRAVSQDREAAMLMGINADRILLLTVTLSGFLAGVAAVFYQAGNANFTAMGWGTLLSAFAVVILGGMGSLYGSVIGAFIIGFIRTFCGLYITPEISDIVPLFVIFIVLVVRPQGILGKKELK